MELAFGRSNMAEAQACPRALCGADIEVRLSPDGWRFVGGLWAVQ